MKIVNYSLLVIMLILISGCKNKEINNESLINSETSENINTVSNNDSEFELFGKPRLCAWRGCHLDINPYTNLIDNYCEENSWPAYKLARNYDFDYFWIASVNYSKDYVFYVMHDNNAYRTCNVDLELRDSLSSQINSLRLNKIGWENWSDSDLRIVVLEDLLKYCFENGIKYGIRLGWLPNKIEMNEYVWNLAINLFERYYVEESIFSGTYEQISIVKKIHNNWNCQVLADKNLNLNDAINFCNNFNVNSYSNMSIIFYTNVLSDVLVNNMHNCKMRIFIVFDCLDDYNYIQDCIMYNVDAIITSRYIDLNLT